MPPHSMEIMNEQHQQNTVAIKPKQWTFENVTDFSLESQKASQAVMQRESSIKVMKMGNNFKSEWKLSKLQKCQSQMVPKSPNPTTIQQQPQHASPLSTLRKCASEHGQFSGISKPSRMRSTNASPTNSVSPVSMSPRSPRPQQIIPPPFISHQVSYPIIQPSQQQQQFSYPLQRVSSFTFPITQQTTYTSPQPQSSIQMQQPVLPSFANFVTGLHLSNS